MTSREDPNPVKPIDESTLLDWIDGRLSEAERAHLETSGRPGLGKRVVQMQANRRALRSAGVERAPLELRDRVLAALERDVLTASAEREEVPESLPISLADNVATGGWSRHWSRTAPALALAAGLVLLIGGAVYWGSLLFGHATPTNTARGPVATNTTTTPEAMNTAGTTDSARVAAKTGDSTPEAALVNDATALAAAETTPSMSIERAAELAREGRLAFRVIAGDTKSLRQLESTGRTAKTWRMTRNTRPEIAAAVLPLAARSEQGRTVVSAEEAARIAEPMFGPGAALTMPAVLPDGPVLRVKGTYLLEVPPTAESIESLRDLFAERLRGEVELAELETPVEQATSPERVLWWTQAPAKWSVRASVPVIIETP